MNMNNEISTNDFQKPMRLLLYERKYLLASLTVVMVSLSWTLALSIRGIVTTCVKYMLSVDDVTAALCTSSIVEGTLSFIIMLGLALLLLHSFLCIAKHVIVGFSNQENQSKTQNVSLHI